MVAVGGWVSSVSNSNDAKLVDFTCLQTVSIARRCLLWVQIHANRYQLAPTLHEHNLETGSRSLEPSKNHHIPRREPPKARPPTNIDGFEKAAHWNIVVGSMNEIRPVAYKVYVRASSQHTNIPMPRSANLCREIDAGLARHM